MQPGALRNILVEWQILDLDLMDMDRRHVNLFQQSCNNSLALYRDAEVASAAGLNCMKAIRLPNRTRTRPPMARESQR